MGLRPTPWGAGTSIRRRSSSTGAPTASARRSAKCAHWRCKTIAATAGPELTFEPGAATIGAGPAPPRGADVWLARYDPDVIEVAVKRGENAGRTLPHADVVRELVLIGHWGGEAERLALPAFERSAARRRRSGADGRRRPDPRRGKGLTGRRIG